MSLLPGLNPCHTAYAVIYTCPGAGEAGEERALSVCILHVTKRTILCRCTLSGHTWGVFHVPLPSLVTPKSLGLTLLYCDIALYMIL